MPRGNALGMVSQLPDQVSVTLRLLSPHALLSISDPTADPNQK